MPSGARQTGDGRGTVRSLLEKFHAIGDRPTSYIASTGTLYALINRSDRKVQEASARGNREPVVRQDEFPFRSRELQLPCGGRAVVDRASGVTHGGARGGARGSSSPSENNAAISGSAVQQSSVSTTWPSRDPNERVPCDAATATSRTSGLPAFAIHDVAPSDDFGDESGQVSFRQTDVDNFHDRLRPGWFIRSSRPKYAGAGLQLLGMTTIEARRDPPSRLFVQTLQPVIH